MFKYFNTFNIGMASHRSYVLTNGSSTVYLKVYSDLFDENSKLPLQTLCEGNTQDFVYVYIDGMTLNATL